MREVELVTWYLEMTDPGQLRPRRLEDPQIAVVRVPGPSPELNRLLYGAVGADWQWTDRLPWTRARWLEHVDRSELETWVAWVGGAPAGYAELELQAGGDVELAMFGLLPGHSGRGLGGHLLTVAVERAWALGAARVWVHTCSLDAPHARAHYERHGFTLYRTETERRRVADVP